MRGNKKSPINSNEDLKLVFSHYFKNEFVKLREEWEENIIDRIEMMVSQKQKKRGKPDLEKALREALNL